MASTVPTLLTELPVRQALPSPHATARTATERHSPSLGRPGPSAEGVARGAEAAAKVVPAGVGMVLEPEDPGPGGLCHVSKLRADGAVASSGAVRLMDRLVAVDGFLCAGAARSEIRRRVVGRLFPAHPPPSLRTPPSITHPADCLHNPQARGV